MSVAQKMESAYGRRDSVLDCASPLPPLIGQRRFEKRQRTGALQNLAVFRVVQDKFSSAQPPLLAVLKKPSQCRRIRFVRAQLDGVNTGRPELSGQFTCLLLLT